MGSLVLLYAKLCSKRLATGASKGMVASELEDWCAKECMSKGGRQAGSAKGRQVIPQKKAGRVHKSTAFAKAGR